MDDLPASRDNAEGSSKGERAVPDFEALLASCRSAVERCVYYRLPSRADADDVLQETYLAAYQKIHTLDDPAAFKPWILRIARNKCSDYFRSLAKALEISLDKAAESALSYTIRGLEEIPAVRETLGRLTSKDQQILYLYYFRGLPQAEIAKRLSLPLGTVKSCLHTAKRNFRNHYPYPPHQKGENAMKKLPDYLPEYRIEESTQQPFAVRWEELMGWFFVPRLGEALSWGMCDIPSRKADRFYAMRATGRAEVHGIEGVDLTAHESDPAGKRTGHDYTFVAQLTETHCRCLACLREEEGVKKYLTFLDGDAFLENWGFGENNSGNETQLHPKGDVQRSGSTIRSVDKPFLLDIAGRYTVTIGGKAFDTVCVIDLETYNPGVVSEQYLDKDGRTVLWRRFNRDDWALGRYQKRWSEQLPDNERLWVNGTEYVHWYGCITDYIL